MLNRRAFNRLLTLGSSAVLPFANPAHSQDQGKPIRLLVGFPAGGTTDLLARLLQEPLQRALGQWVIIDNKGGAGGQIAAQSLMASPPDGQTLMLTIEHTQVLIPLTMKTAGYDAVKDFTAIAGVSTPPSCMVVSTQIGAKNMQEFAVWLRSHPKEANYGTPAMGSVPQFSGFLVGQSLGVPMVPVQYRGGAPLVADLLAGHIQFAFGAMNDYLPHHRTGKMRILAVSGTERNRAAPEVPTYAEVGIQGLTRDTWTGLFGPKGMAPATVQRINAAVATVLADPAVQQKMAATGNDRRWTSPQELQTWVSEGQTHWGAVIKASGFEPT